MPRSTSTPEHLSVRRMHFRADGAPKKAVSPAGARRLRAAGWHSYLCPICGKTHASPRYADA